MIVDERDGLIGGTVVSKSSLEEVKKFYNTVGSNWGDSYRSKDDAVPDPAVLRLNVVFKFIERYGCENFFDAGCADAPVMLELLRRGKVVRGVDFSETLVENGKSLLSKHGFDPGLCEIGDVTCLDEPNDTYDTILCLGVLPHIDRMDKAIKELVRITKPRGILILSFRNDLFDLFTFNRFTLEFFTDLFLPMVPFSEDEHERALKGLNSLLTFPDKPDVDCTDIAQTKFNRLTRINHNPLTIGQDMAPFGITHLMNGYYKFHPVPPLLQNQFPNFREIGAKMDETLSFSWLGMFMCSTFVAAFRKGKDKLHQR